MEIRCIGADRISTSKIPEHKAELKLTGNSAVIYLSIWELKCSVIQKSSNSTALIFHLLKYKLQVMLRQNGNRQNGLVLNRVSVMSIAKYLQRATLLRVYRQ